MIIDIHTHHNSVDQHLLLVQSMNLASTSSSEDAFSFTPSRYFSLGLHPWSASLWSSNLQSKLEAQLMHASVLFIGEIGIDKRCGVPYAIQKNAYYAQLEVANKLRKPVLIHMVRSMDDIAASKKQYPAIPAWVIHGFRGKPSEALRMVKLGFYLSFGPRFNAQSIAYCPTNSLFLETDDSGTDIKEMYQGVSSLKGISVLDLEQRIMDNLTACCVK